MATTLLQQFIRSISRRRHNSQYLRNIQFPTIMNFGDDIPQMQMISRTYPLCTHDFS